MLGWSEDAHYYPQTPLMLPLFPLCLKDSLHTEAMAASVCLFLLCATWACGLTPVPCLLAPEQCLTLWSGHRLCDQDMNTAYLKGRIHLDWNMKWKLIPG